MGKKKGPAWQFFKDKNKGGVVCKYCNIEYKHANVNKMTNHIRKCFKCPEDMKMVLIQQTTKPNSNKEISMTAEKEMSLEVDISYEPENPELGGPSSSSSQTLSFASPSNASERSELSTISPRPQLAPTASRNSRGGLLTFLDHMDGQLNESLNQSLAKAVFVSGAPLSMVEHPLWLEFLRKLRPSYKPPSRYRLTSSYLKAQYTEMQNEVTSQLNDSKHLHLQCDGWSNIRNESIVNFVVSKPEPLFVDFVATKENRHNAPYLAELIINVIEKYGVEKFLVVIGDNASNMRAALALVKEKHPSVVPLGCLAHLLHLLCEDILKCNTVKSFIATVIGIVKSIKNSHILKAIFDRLQLEKKFEDRVSLKLPGQTRWGSNLFSLQSLLSNKSVLQKLAVSEEADITPDMKRQLLDDGVFWIRVQKMVNILDPIIELINSFQSNTPTIHKVYTKFHSLQETLKKEIPESPLQKTEEKTVLAKLEKRVKFGVGKIHLAADLLNPSSQGCSLKPDELLDAIEFIGEVGNRMEINAVDLRQDIADYRDKEGLWRRSFIWEGVKVKVKDGEKAVSPILWWRSLKGTCILADVAIRILGAPVTSAATERTFSTFSWIHNKKRNRLTTERAGQIAYLSHNWNLLNRTPKPNKIMREKRQDGCSTKEVEDNNDRMQVSCSDSESSGHQSLSSHSSDEEAYAYISEED